MKNLTDFKISDHLEFSDHKSLLFKLPFNNQSLSNICSNTDFKMDQLKQKLSFVSIKVKKQVYLGEEAIAIHIRDVSKKILSKLYFL